MKILTRKEIIEIWLKQPEAMLNSYCCPNCRDILRKKRNGKYSCDNRLCRDRAIRELNNN